MTLPPVDEAHGRRLDRELNELLQELRVIQGGILLLVGFLLVVAFSSRFADVSTFDKWVYFATLMVTGVAAIVVVSPVVHHRLAFRRRDKERVVVRGNLMILLAIMLVSVSMLGIAVLVSDVLWHAWVVWLVGVGYVVLVLTLWVMAPLHSLRASAAEQVAGE